MFMRSVRPVHGADKFTSFVGFDMYHVMSAEQESKQAMNRPMPVPGKPDGGGPQKVLDGGGDKGGGRNPPPPGGDSGPASAATRTGETTRVQVPPEAALQAAQRVVVQRRVAQQVRVPPLGRSVSPPSRERRSPREQLWPARNWAVRSGVPRTARQVPPRKVRHRRHRLTGPRQRHPRPHLLPGRRLRRHNKVRPHAPPPHHRQRHHRRPRRRRTTREIPSRGGE